MTQGNFAPEGKVKAAAWIVVIVLVVIVFFTVGGKISNLFKGISSAFNDLLGNLGIGASPEEQENKGIVDEATRGETALGVKSAWSPLYWKQKAGAKIFTQAKTNALVQQLWDSVGYTIDSPEKFVAAIKQCTFKSQVSWLCYNFSEVHQTDLLEWASRHFDTADQKYQLAIAIKYVASLQSGY
jgi:hypothetical protein